jgi:hypothetical protein
MYYFCHFITIGLEMSHGALCSTIFDEFRNAKLLWDNHIWDQTHLCCPYWIIYVYPFNDFESGFQRLYLILINAIGWLSLVGVVSKCIHDCRGWCRCRWLLKCWIMLRILTMFTHSFFGLSYCWNLIKGDRSVRRTFTRGISQCLLE